MRISVSRRPGAERVVTPVELFFDLVYVFGISQLSHHLVEHVDLRTGAETAVLTFAVLYAWYMTAWAANWLDPGRLPVRLLLLGLMFASLLMSVGIGEAFGDRAWLFVVGYLGLQLGRTVFLVVGLRGQPLGEHFVNDLVWETATGALWIAGAIADADTRLWLWALAVAVTYGAVQTQHWLPGRGRRIDLGHSDIAGGHLLERLRLFFLIALGETVLTMGMAFTGEPFAVDRLVALAISFLASVAIWWTYFDHVEDDVSRAVERVDDAGAIGWSGTLAVTVAVLALIAVAVAAELAIAHPGDDATAGFTILAFGGPALLLLDQLVFLRRAMGQVTRSRALGAAALVVLGTVVGVAELPLLAGTAAASAVLVAVAISDGAGADTAILPPHGPSP